MSGRTRNCLEEDWEGVRANGKERVDQGQRQRGYERRAYSSASLQMIPSDRRSIVHRVERRYLVHAHGWHLEHTRDFVHYAETSPAKLALA